MSGERIDPQSILERMMKFMGEPETDVNNYVITGLADNGQLGFHTFVGLYPPLTSSSDPGCVIVEVKRKRLGAGEVYSKILGLDIPQRIKDLNVVDHPELRETLEAKMKLHQMPHVLLTLALT